MNKKFLCAFLFVSIFVCMLATARAVPAIDVAYILEDGSQVNGNIVLNLNQVGLSYEVVRDNQIPTADFSRYSMLLVVEDVTNKDRLPFQSKHAIFFDQHIAQIVWPGSQTGVTTNARQIKVVDDDHALFEGVLIPADGVIDVYGGSGEEMNYLRTKPLYVIPLAIRTTENRPVIAYSIRSMAGYPVRDIMFGISSEGGWNANAQRIFRNALTFMMADVDQDQDGFRYEEDCNDQNPLVNPDATEVTYDGIDQDCNGFDDIDADDDGYCSQGRIIQNALFQCAMEHGTIGSDCNDHDSVINPGYSDLTQNCVNDPPIFVDVPHGLSFGEGDTVSFSVTANDFEDGDLDYSINDARFDVDGNTFSWETGYHDAGSYSFVITVSDGQFDVTTPVFFQVTEVNSPPEAHAIPDIVWDEETTFSVNVSRYFSDSDSQQMTFGVATFPDERKVDVVSENNGIVVLSAQDNFFGEEEISFYADDGISRTISDNVTLLVRNINDAPGFEREIGDFTMNEDEVFRNFLNLSAHFGDVDSELSFEAVGATHLTFSFNGDFATITPDHDFFGTETVFLRATDGEFTLESNTFNVTVRDRGEPPVLVSLNCTTQLIEDTIYSCELAASDFEGNAITFSATNKTNLECDVSGNVLTYRSTENYNGPASCIVRATDIDGFDAASLQVQIAPVNDAPAIVSYTPQVETVHLISGWHKNFTIQSKDVDSSTITSWFVSSNFVKEEMSNSSSFTFLQQPIGNYMIEAIVRDSDYQTNRLWNVVVGNAQDFTCADIGGAICKERETCSETFLGVRDTSACCMAQCIPAFDDAHSCETLSHNISIDISDFESNVELGDTMKVEFKLFNGLHDDQTFDVETHLYNLDKDKSLEQVDSETEIGAGRFRTLRVDVPIPEDLDLERDSFAIFVVASDDECGQSYSIAHIERPDAQLAIDDFELPDQVMCGETVPAIVKVENLGAKQQDVNLTIESSSLKLKETANFEVDEFGTDDDSHKEKISLEFPDDIDSGEYELKATIVYDENRRETITQKITVDCEEEQVKSSAIVPQEIDEDKITLNQVEGITLETPTKKKINYAPLALVGTLNVLLIGCALVLYLIYRRSN